VAVRELVEDPYLEVLCYPHPSPEEAQARVQELLGLGVTHLIFAGRVQLGALKVLGKGCVGVVVKGLLEGREVAVKIRRVDANRPSLSQEAQLTLEANRLGVGPRLHHHSENFLVMELVRGVEIGEFLHQARDRSGVAPTLQELLHQCYRLDRAHLDHGELANLRRHVYVAPTLGPRVWIVDFETASRERRPRNLTSATQYLLIGGPYAPKLRRILGLAGLEPLLKALKAYKQEPSPRTYQALLEVVHL
jgi:putative serine/threonine protein kinase